MAEKGETGSSKPTLTAAEKQLYRSRQELNYMKQQAARIRSRNLMTGLAIGAFVVGMSTPSCPSNRREL
ncbi:cytochrome c oxidase assembly factor 3 homolog%2C mitochondrial [Scomber scombrus]|uniref:Cytochrome c oxidase assembly factor 3 homolog, mitochondrial n=1 Tax=Scomber scombrus TaxID=13677 RepID=A0AAV1NN41_SCOSC